MAAAPTPWPPQYKAGGTRADVLGPDGSTYFPDFAYAGVEGGIPQAPAFATIEQFGGRADDDLDDSAALQAACEAAGRAGGGAVLLGAGTYHLDSKVTITGSGVVIRGAGRDRTKLVVRYNGAENRITDGVILFAGGEDGPPQPLAADGRRGDTVLGLRDAAGVGPGDYLLVRAEGTPRWRSLIQSACRLNPRMAIVRAVAVEGASVRINQPLRIDFPVEDAASVSVMSPIERCGIEDLSIAQAHREPKICTVLFLRAADCWGRRVRVDWTGRMPLYGSNVKRMEVRDCEFNNAHDMGGGGTAYVGWQYGFDCLMEGVTTRHMRHAPNLDWCSSGCVFRNSAFYYSDAQTHAGWCHENLFENCLIIDPRSRPSGGGSYGHGFWSTPPSDSSHGPNGPRNVFYNCDIQNQGEHVVFEEDMARYGPTGFVLGGMNENWLFFHNRILTRGPGILLRGTHFDHIVKDNIFAVAEGFPAVALEEPGQTSGLELVGNTFYGGNGALVTAGGTAIARDEGNVVRALPGEVPARPSPQAPSLYEWQMAQRR
jgi:hypothetical protein